ncbi:flagellin, partial [Actinoplanes sp. TRM 88003]|nr:flagellin [Actinoplanes aksuensis]
LNAELDRIGKSTAFGKQNLLDGTFGATKSTTGTAIAANGDKAAGIPTSLAGGFTFTLEKVGGSDKDPSGNSLAAGGTPPNGPITVTVGKLADDATPQDLARAVNEGLQSALKQHGFQGTEVSMSAKVDSQNNSTFKMSGAGDFSITNAGDLATAPAAADPTTGRNTGGLGMDMTTANLKDTGGNTGKFQVGANANQKIAITIGGVDSETLGTAALDLTKDPDAAIK